MFSSSNFTRHSLTGDTIEFKGVRRARYSFHFATRRARRWLLVQWVSVPTVAAQDAGFESEYQAPAREVQPVDAWRSIEANRIFSPAARLY